MVCSSELDRVVTSSHGRFALVYCSDLSVAFGLLVNSKVAGQFLASIDCASVPVDELGLFSDDMLFLFTPDSVLTSVPYDQVNRIMTFTGSCIDHCNQMYLDPNDYLNEFKLFISS